MAKQDTYHVKKYDSMTVDQLDVEHMRIREEQPDHMKDRLRAIKAVRDVKVEKERRADYVRKLLINGAGYSPEQVDEFLKTKSLDEVNALIAPFDEIANQIGVVVTPENGEVKAEGQEVEK